jgi:uncharacterized protein (DUF58 family)
MIPQSYLKNIRRVEIRTRRLAEEFLSGAYRSVFKGRGMDFEDVRGYMAGDDVRHIDWNVSARMNATFVKEFKEERELSVVIAIDISASEDFGTASPAGPASRSRRSPAAKDASAGSTKRELAAEVAACLAFSAISNGDKVGLVLFSDRVERYLPPRKGRTQALRIIRDVLYFKAAHRGTSLKRALNFLNHAQRRRAIVFLVSDFLDEGFDRSLKVTSRRHDLIPLLIQDAREQTLPDAGAIAVADAETGEVLELDTGRPEVREAFARLSRERIEGLRGRLRRSGTDAVELTTGEPYIGPIRNYMEKRMRQHRR